MGTMEKTYRPIEEESLGWFPNVYKRTTTILCCILGLQVQVAKEKRVTNKNLG